MPPGGRVANEGWSAACTAGGAAVQETGQSRPPVVASVLLIEQQSGQWATISSCTSDPRLVLQGGWPRAGPSFSASQAFPMQQRPSWATAQRHRPGGGALLLPLLLLAAAAAVRAVRDTKYYDHLGVSPDADEKTIQKAYRRQAL